MLNIRKDKEVARPLRMASRSFEAAEEHIIIVGILSGVWSDLKTEGVCHANLAR
jgi:hypothetical protein